MQEQFTEQEIRDLKRRRLLQQTERLMDEMTLPQMVELMSEICYEKASHLRENWQDEKAAKLWEKNAKQLEKLAPKLYS